MSTAPAPVAAAPTAAVTAPADVKAVIEPAVPTPKPTIAAPDKILANIKARIAEANKEPAKVEPVQAGSTPAPDPAKPTEILPDAKAALAELAKAQAKVKEWQDKAKALEAQSQDAEFGKTVKSAKTTKERIEAIAKAEGKDPVDLMADLVAEFYAEHGTPDPNKPQAATGELKAVLDRLELVSKELAEIKAGKTQETEAQTKAKVEQQEAATKAYIKAVAEKYKGEFEISARPENIEEAIAKAIAKAPAVLERLGFDPAQLSEEQAEQLAKEAIAEAEKEFTELGKRFGKVVPEQRLRAYDIPLSKPKLEFGKREPLRSGSQAEWERYKEQMKAKYEASAAQHFGTGRTYQSADDSRQAGITR